MRRFKKGEVQERVVEAIRKWNKKWNWVSVFYIIHEVYHEGEVSGDYTKGEANRVYQALRSLEKKGKIERRYRTITKADMTRKDWSKPGGFLRWTEVKMRE